MVTLSVCINHKNRAYCEHDGRLIPLFRRGWDQLLAALNMTVRNDAEIVLIDWPAREPGIGALGPWCDDARLRLVTMGYDEAFTRGGGRNRAGDLAAGDVLFFLDADMLVPPELIRRGLEVAAAGNALFPYYRRQTRTGELVDGRGTGNSFLPRRLWTTPPQPRFTEKVEWGGEDTKFCGAVSRRTAVVREMIPGFIHQWHPGAGAA